MSVLKVEVEAKITPTASVEQPIPVLASNIPVGGEKGQVLTKKSGKPYDVAWENPKGGEGGGGVIVEGVTEERVEEIVSEKTADLQPKTDESLETESKQVGGAINEVNSGLVKGINSSITEETNELVLELKGKDGTVLVSTKVQLPKSELPDLSAFVKASDFLEGAGAPTTETVAPFVGALYLDTTNNNTYQCTAIDKETPSYTWVKLIRSTDRASAKNHGVVRMHNSYGVQMYNEDFLATVPATDNDIKTRDSSYKPLTPKNMDKAHKEVMTNSKETWTDEDKTKACETIGAVAKQTKALILYGTDSNGNQTTWSVRNTNNTKNTIAGRDSNGNIQVGSAINATDATNKEYVVNLPDKITLDEEAKAKWRAWLGIE